jgi:sulfofructose kinase
MTALVLCCGQIVMDHSFSVDEIEAPPSKVTARKYHAGVGGMSAHAAIAVARLGGRVAFWGRVGDDAAGEALARAMADEGVDITGLKRFAGAQTPLSAVIIDKRGERSIITHRGSGLATETDWLPWDMLDGAGAVLCDPRWLQGTTAVFAAARARKIPSVLDAEKSEMRVLLDLVPLVDHAIFAASGLRIFAGVSQATEGLRRALASGPLKLAAVTRGENGTLWLTPGMARPAELPAFKVVATNTTGAGDVFHGAYALALAEGQATPQALRFASAAGALRARDGETPTRAMVEAMLSGG